MLMITASISRSLVVEAWLALKFELVLKQLLQQVCIDRLRESTVIEPAGITQQHVDIAPKPSERRASNSVIVYQVAQTKIESVRAAQSLRDAVDDGVLE